MPGSRHHPKFQTSDLDVEIRMLRSEQAPGAVEWSANHQFVMKNHGALSHDALCWLLRLTPIYVVPIPRKNLYRVIFGRRLFELAAFGLAPSDTVPVKLIVGKLLEELVDTLNYLDTAVLTTTHSLDLSHAALYELISHDKAGASNAWTIATKAEFARVFDVSRSSLSSQDKSRKGLRA